MSLHDRGARILGAGIGIGFAAGLLPASALAGVTVFVAKQGVAIALGLIGIASLLAMVAGGWVALILHYRWHRHWRALGAAVVLLNGAALGLGLVAPERPRQNPRWHMPTGIVWPLAVLSGMYVVLAALNVAAEADH